MKKIVTHKHCVDGFLSEFILRDIYPDAEFVAVSYGPEHEALEPCEKMLFCDMSPPRSKYAEFRAAGAVVLDHHATAKGWFSGGGEGIYADAPGISGAGLALLHHERTTGKRMDEGGPVGTALLELTRLVGLYDTWQEKHADFRSACAAHAGIDLIMESGFRGKSLGWLLSEMGQLGRAMVYMHERNLRRAEKIARDALRVTVSTPNGPVALALVDQGKIGTTVLNLVPGARDDIDLWAFSSFDEMRNVPSGTGPGAISSPPRLKVSLRSRGDLVDCGQIAARFGGGGHRGSGGFTSEPLSEVRTSDLAYIMLMSAFRNGEEPE